jgi:hypothetical protein
MSTIHHGHGPRAGHEPIHPVVAAPHPERRKRLEAAPAPSSPARLLLINAAARSDGSWAGEAAKTWRLTELARQTLEAEGAATEVLDLGLAPPGGPQDAWADAIRAKWAGAHGIVVLAPAALDTLDVIRRVLAEPRRARELEDRAYGIVVHGAPACIGHARAALADWLDGLGLVDSDSFGPLNRYVGYHEEDGTWNGAEPDYEEEVRNVARAVHKAVTELRAGRLAGTAPA